MAYDSLRVLSGRQLACVSRELSEHDTVGSSVELTVYLWLTVEGTSQQDLSSERHPRSRIEPG